ncbi:WhiB family transcriptional regulator [Planotetraspora sp. A-T 1434]|uniref:WhiB family transcriptional regulator n=1 Tax=Planotetraspora sp. A-T 1434 TaxID=2979219 RepID=UPI0021BFE506|nr:WhiB family transcriptional regulator [Planotetraspora sp. A-T 1434]MCT9932474.1 WhiB family transcriptional regulator [Planotetraspora sp. A-T 1434]
MNTPQGDLLDELRWTVTTFGTCAKSSTPDAWFPPEPPLWATPRANEPVDVLTAQWEKDARAEYEEFAQALCKGCPVQAECLELALREEETLPRSEIHGVSGAAAPWQRWQMRRNRRRAAQRAGKAAA